MNVPMPGGMFVSVEDEEKKRYASSGPHRRTTADEFRMASPSTSSSSSSSPSVSPPVVAAAVPRDSMTSQSVVSSNPSSVGSSTVLSELNCVHSFDDQGRAASYLQFFIKNQRGQQQQQQQPSHLHLPVSPLKSQSQQQQHHQFGFDVYSTDLTTRTPNRVARMPPPSRTAVAAVPIDSPSSLLTSETNFADFTTKQDEYSDSHCFDHVNVNPKLVRSSVPSSTSSPSKLYDDSAASYSSGSSSSTNSDTEISSRVSFASRSTSNTQPLYAHQRTNTSNGSLRSTTKRTATVAMVVGSQTSSATNVGKRQSNGSSSNSTTRTGDSRSLMLSKSQSILSHSPSSENDDDDSSVLFSDAEFPRQTYAVPLRLSRDQRPNENCGGEDTLSCPSSASHLFGESLITSASASAVGDNGGQPNERVASGLTSPTQSETLSYHPSSRTGSSNTSESSHQSHSGVWTTTTTALQSVQQQVRHWWAQAVAGDQLLPNYNRHQTSRSKKVESPWSRTNPKNNTTGSSTAWDLRYLATQHKLKCAQMTRGLSSHDSRRTATSECNDDDDDSFFDFALILQPQNVYGFWAELLDFRVEVLGQHVVDAMQEQWGIHGQDDSLRLVGGSSASLCLRDSRSTVTSDSGDSDEAQDIFSAATVATTTPLSGVRRRRHQYHHHHRSTHLSTTPSMMDDSNNPNSTPFTAGSQLTPSVAASPGIYSALSVHHGESLRNVTTAKKQSLFERALESPDLAYHHSPGAALNESAVLSVADAKAVSVGGALSTPLQPPTYRRRWGNQVVGGGTTIKLPMMSPPVHSLVRQTPAVELNNKSRLPHCIPLSDEANNDSTEQPDHNTENHDPNTLRIEDIPNQVIARGIAARTNRTNGMLPFLSALKRGIVLRRHRPMQEAGFCKISSVDGGDTILYQPVDHEEAMNAFREQRVRYNKSTDLSDPTDMSHWSFERNDADHGEGIIPHNFSMPDYVAADAYRKRLAAKVNGQVGRKMKELATKVVGTGTAKVSDVVAVHPARNKDPRSDTGELSSSSLRRSKSEYSPQLAFSLVTLRGGHHKKKDNMEDHEAKWHEGEGNDVQFKYLDFEVATEGEYWLIFRGLLLLHRDAAVGRFAKQRAAGIGTNVDISSDMEYHLHKDEFHEPLTVGWLERTIVRCRKLDTTYMDGFVSKEGAVPPPSDYFLGFRSPGTAIWSRLRQAGLETRRIYSLDPNRVMIKIRCPSDRLMDVAEVLRVKLKTKDGSFAPFREDMIDAFDSMDDPLERLPPHNMDWYNTFQFRSSLRQNIIAFIIGSRIRDSGAELGQTTELGQMIQARVPLHVHSKLEAIFNSWFYFWTVENWSNGRTGDSLTHRRSSENRDDVFNSSKLSVEQGGEDLSKKDSFVDRQTPNLLTRIFVGCMHQPLDSIETYFGEKVAFYFTWLQHTASHLVFLSIAGLILFMMQISSGRPDHPLRPYFSVVVMIWTFLVLINWKKRANFMAYRWGTMNYKEQETTRPQFKGDYTQDEITGEWIVTCPKWKRWLKYCVSFPLTLFFTGGTLLLILWVHANRDTQLAAYFPPNATMVEDFEIDRFALSNIGKRSHVAEVALTKEHLQSPKFWFIVVLLPSMLGLFLPLLNFVIMTVSTMLNDFENYRTESEYRTYLIIKVFSFRFVCYFATLYYYSILSLGDEAAVKNGILRVGTGVLVYVTVAQWWQSILHVCFPMIVRSVRMKHRSKRLANELRDIEMEEAEIIRLSAIRIDDSIRERQVRLVNKRLLLEQAQDPIWIELMNPDHDSFPEYIQAVVQFAFVSCFSVILPITPLIVLFNHLVSMRLDAYKLCKGRRRPIAEKTGGIGVWEHVLHIVAVISVLTNCWLMGFTSSQFTWMKTRVGGDLGLFALVVVWEHFMLLIKYVMSTSMSTLPKTVRDAMKRERYELDKQRNLLMHERRRQQQLNEEQHENSRQVSARLRRRSNRSLKSDEDDAGIDTTGQRRRKEEV